MNLSHFSRTCATCTYRVVRILVSLIAVVIFLGLGLFIYLRVQGVPAPIVHKITKRLNETGVPVSMESIMLTFGGWRANQVQIYDQQPDGHRSQVLLHADSLFFSVHKKVTKDGFKIHTKMKGVTLSPAQNWGIELPKICAAREIGQVKASFDFSPHCIKLTAGELTWLGIRLNLTGEVLKGPNSHSPFKKGSQPKFQITKEQVENIEEQLRILSLPHGVDAKVNFLVDTEDYTQSRVDFLVKASDLAIQQIAFTKAEILGQCDATALRFERIGLFMDNESVQLNGEYNLKSKQVNGSLFNSITSNQPLQLLPPIAQSMLTLIGLQFNELPQFKIKFGPSLAKELPNHLMGTFSIQDLLYQGIEVERLRGKVTRVNNRLELTQLHGLAKGQENRAKEVGSSMHGGTVKGDVFWDQDSREFGVSVDGSLDPNLLIQALSPVSIATNIIQLFSFNDQPLQGHLELGAMVDDWNTFFIDIQAVASDVVFRGVQFDSVKLTETYQHGLLTLNPIAVTCNATSANGAVGVDFHKDIATFKIDSTVDPAALEDVIFPDLNLFGKKIKTQGDVHFSGRGKMDWRTMKVTDISAKLAAKQVEIPVGTVTDFLTDLNWKGTQLNLENMNFSLFDGRGAGQFSIQIDPTKKTMPYEFNTTFSTIDFKKFLQTVSTKNITATGVFSGRIKINADMATNFFAAATGTMSLRVDNGQLADLPLLGGFSKIIRKILPRFNTFSITSLSGDLTLNHGIFASENTQFNGDIISASGRGTYDLATGFHAIIQTHILQKDGLLKLIELVTNPLTKLFELQLTGRLGNPSWKLDRF